MEYENETWRLPLPSGKRHHVHSKPLHMSNSYSPLLNLMEQDHQGATVAKSDLDQTRFELQRKREKEVSILHDVFHRHSLLGKSVEDISVFLEYKHAVLVCSAQRTARESNTRAASPHGSEGSP